MNDKHFLKLALKQARIRQGFCAPNPSVGSILVDKNHNILAEGYHHGAGLPHAEIEVLKQLAYKAPDDATLYVTLEPCCHWGKTPPCVDAIIRAGVKRVVYGFKDPNPLVSGKGHEQLLVAGIQCDYVEIKAITDFYQGYKYWQLNKLPFVTAKIALSLNGAIADESGKPVQITGKKLQQFTHISRKTSDAILTTINTILHDDPRLNVRLKNSPLAKPIYVLDSYLQFPKTANLLKTAQSITLLHGKDIDSSVRDYWSNQGVRCIEIDKDRDGLNLSQVLSLIGKDGMHHLWVEAGGKCFASLLSRKLLQQAYIYVSLRWLNHGKIAFPMGISLDEMSQKISWRQFGNDVMCTIRF